MLITSTNKATELFLFSWGKWLDSALHCYIHLIYLLHLGSTIWLCAFWRGSWGMGALLPEEDIFTIVSNFAVKFGSVDLTFCLEMQLLLLLQGPKKSAIHWVNNWLVHLAQCCLSTLTVIGSPGFQTGVSVSPIWVELGAPPLSYSLPHSVMLYLAHKHTKACILHFLLK